MDVLFGSEGGRGRHQLTVRAVLAAFLVAPPVGDRDRDPGPRVLRRCATPARRSPPRCVAVVVSIAISIARRADARRAGAGPRDRDRVVVRDRALVLPARTGGSRRSHVGALVRGASRCSPLCGALAGATLWAVLAGAHAIVTPGPGRSSRHRQCARARRRRARRRARLSRPRPVPGGSRRSRRSCACSVPRSGASPPRDRDTRARPARRAGRLGRLRGRERARARTSSGPPGRGSRRSTGGEARASWPAARRRSGRRSSSAGRARFPGRSPTHRAGRWRRRGRRSRSPRSPRRSGPGTLGRVSHVRIDPEVERDGPLDAGGSLRAILARAGWRPAPPIQPPSTRVIDLAAGEEALWGDLRKKWRQYVNKARANGVTVVELARRPDRPVLRDLPGDGAPGRLPDPGRAGLPRRLGRLSADRRRDAPVRDRHGGHAPGGAVPGPQRAPGRGAVRRHDRRRCRPAGELPPQVGGHPSLPEAGATTYDLWGLAHPGIAQFKVGFGGREVRFVGAWDLVLSGLGTAALPQRPAAAASAGAPPGRPCRRWSTRPGGTRRGCRGRRRGRRREMSREPGVHDGVVRRRSRAGTIGPSGFPGATSSSRWPGASTGLGPAGSCITCELDDGSAVLVLGRPLAAARGRAPLRVEGAGRSGGAPATVSPTGSRRSPAGPRGWLRHDHRRRGDSRRDRLPGGAGRARLPAGRGDRARPATGSRRRSPPGADDDALLAGDRDHDPPAVRRAPSGAACGSSATTRRRTGRRVRRASTRRRPAARTTAAIAAFDAVPRPPARHR